MRKSVLLKAPLLTRSGYGEQSRFALRALRSREDLFDVYIQPIAWGQTSWNNELTEERLWIDETIQKTIDFIQNGGQFDISLQVTIPNEWEKIAPVNIGYTAGIETTKVHHQWLIKANELDKIIVVSKHAKDVFEDTVYDAFNEQTQEEVKLKVRHGTIDYVNYPVKLYEELSPVELKLDYDFNFLTVAQMGPRKNLENTIKWFIEEFKDEEVGLVVKTNVARNSQIDKEVVHGRLMHIVRQYEDIKCKIYMIHGDMTDEEMHSLYLHPQLKASLSLTHGEGFGLPLFESAYMGVPVVATGWSGQLDFLCDEDGTRNFYDVSFDLQQVPEDVVWEGVITKDSFWAYAREQSAKEKMRQCYSDITNGEYPYSDLPEKLKERFEESKQYAAFVAAMGVEQTFDIESWLDELDVDEIE